MYILSKFSEKAECQDLYKYQVLIAALRVCTLVFSAPYVFALLALSMTSHTHRKDCISPLLEVLEKHQNRKKILQHDVTIAALLDGAANPSTIEQIIEPESKNSM